MSAGADQDPDETAAAAPGGEEQPETWELLNEELRHRLDVQRAAAQRLETKAAVVIGAALTAVQFVAKEPIRSYWLPLAVGAYLLSIGAGLLAVLPQVFHETGPRPMVTGLWLYPRGRAAAELANNRLVAYEMNVERHGRRVTFVRASILALVMGAILSVTHLTLGARTDVRQTTGTCGASTAGCRPSA